MNTIFRQLGFLAPGWKDLIEIIIVTVIFYRVLLVFAGTRAMQILLGVLFLVVVYFAAAALNLDLLSYLLRTVFQFGAIAAIVIFQPELRNALAHLGQNRLMRFFNRLEESQVAEEIALAAEEMSRSKTGAIMAVEQEMGLGEYLETGSELSARVSSVLLSTIFAPLTPLHDGAVIIQGDTIIAAGVILPLTQFPVMDKSLGTRHRAAIGLSEETDALVVVVSEETGQMSLAYRGQLHRDLDRERLSMLLASPREERLAPALA